MTTQMKKRTMPGIAYPATVLDLATAPSYPAPQALCGDGCPPPGQGLNRAVRDVPRAEMALPALH